MRLIALTGYTGAGKDTIANRYRATWGAYHTKYADPMRAVVYQKNGWDLSRAGDRGYEEGDKITEIIRFSQGVLEIYPNLWVDLWEMTLPPDSRSRMVVVSDLRQPQELERIRTLGGIAYRVVRPDNPHKPRALDHLLDDVKLLEVQSQDPCLPMGVDTVCNGYVRPPGLDPQAQLLVEQAVESLGVSLGAVLQGVEYLKLTRNNPLTQG